MNIKKDKVMQVRMNKEWKDEVMTLCKINRVSFGRFIRESVDANMDSLTKPITVDDAGCDVATGRFLG